MELIPVHMDNINKIQANKTLFKKSKRYLSDSDSEIENQNNTEKFPKINPTSVKKVNNGFLLIEVSQKSQANEILRWKTCIILKSKLSLT